MQALLLSVSGFLAAAALAAVIIFKGDSLTTEVRAPPISPQTHTCMYIFRWTHTPIPPSLTPNPQYQNNQLLNEAYEERDSLRQRVGASQDEDGTIVVGFGTDAKPQQEEAAAAPAAVAEKEKEKELVGSAASGGGGGAVNDFED